MTELSRSLRRQLGDIDIYLFDQLLRGRLEPPLRLLDAGCGAGRNLVLFLQHDFEVYACDRDPSQLAAVRRLASSLAGELPEGRLRCEPIESLSFPDGFFGAVLSCAVLHFAPDEAAFGAMLREMWRVLAPGGLFFARLASSIGIESRLDPIDGRRARLPDGSERFLVDEALLLERTDELGARLLDPLKTTNVQGLRCMTTWVLEKPLPNLSEAATR